MASHRAGIVGHLRGKARGLAERLIEEGELPISGYEALLKGCDDGTQNLLADRARVIRESVYGRDVYIRGLIEISNCCRNDCLYCGLRKSNRSCSRYRLSQDEICACADDGYALGFRTFVLQGGEDPALTDGFLTSVIRSIKVSHPDCAVTLSLGERSRVSYERLFKAGAERYLLREETVCDSLYAKLHPHEMSCAARLRCIIALKNIGYDTGCGFMVGVPHQEMGHIARDLKFIERWQPEMCGIGPFIPHHATPFAKYPTGSVQLTCLLLSIIRIACPAILLPATTALATLGNRGRERGLLSGANVVMPNLSPAGVRKKYELYDGKAHTLTEAAENIDLLREQVKAIGYHVVTDRGDPKAAGKTLAPGSDHNPAKKGTDSPIRAGYL